MRVIKIYIFFQIVFIGNIFSQGSEDFNLKLPNTKISFSNFNILNVIDQRSDTTNIGFLYGTILNKTIFVQPSIPFSYQLQSIVYQSSDSSNSGELLIQIRKMKFIQRTSLYDDNAIFFFRANLYKKTENNFEKLAYIDTLLIVPNSDPIKTIKGEASNVVTNFLLKNMQILPVDEKKQSYFEVLKIDSIEKSKLKAYCVSEYINGVYMNFESFKNQSPNYTTTKIKFKNKSIKKVKILNAEGKKIKLQNKEIFAVVENGKIHISAEYGYCTLYRFNGDFYFIGRAKVSRDPVESVLLAVFLPAVPLIIAAPAIIAASQSNKPYFEIKIDHVDGSFMRVKQLNSY